VGLRTKVEEAIDARQRHNVKVVVDCHKQFYRGDIDAPGVVPDDDGNESWFHSTKYPCLSEHSYLDIGDGCDD
jgi:hypothetical protein